MKLKIRTFKVLIRPQFSPCQRTRRDVMDYELGNSMERSKMMWTDVIAINDAGDILIQERIVSTMRGQCQ